MDKEGWIAQLGRLYTEVSNARGASQGSSAHANQFNQTLSELKEAYPEEEFVQNMEEVHTSNRSSPFDAQDTNQEVKLKCGQLADALGYDLPKSELESAGDVTVISLAAEQSNEQTVNQELSFDQTIEMVNYTTLGETQQEELKELIHEFKNELEEEQDESRLRDLLSRASDYSKDVAANMAMLALKKGATGVLNLG